MTNKFYFVLFSLVFLSTVSASINPEPLNYFSDNSGTELDTIDGCDIVNFKFDSEKETLSFEIFNNNDYPVTLTVYDIYSKRNTEIHLSPGKNIEEFYSVKLKGGQFCFVFWKIGGNMAIVKEQAVPITLADKFYIASSTALGFLSFQSGMIFAILVVIGQLVVSKLLYKKMLIDHWKQGSPVMVSLVFLLLILMLTIKYGLPFGWYDIITIGRWDFVFRLPFFDFSNWEFLYLVSYFNWIYPLALCIGFGLGFKLSKPEYLNLLYLNFKENSRDLMILPVSFRKDVATVRFIDGKIRKIIIPKVNNTKYINPYTQELEDLYEITSYDLKDTPEKTYNETTPVNRILTYFEKIIEYLKDYLGRTKGAIEIEFSKIMTKTVAESIFLHDNLEAISESVNVWAKKFYDEKYQKSIKAQEFTAVAVEKIARDLNPLAKENITDLLGGIDDFFDMGIETYKKEDTATKNGVENGPNSSGTENIS